MILFLINTRIEKVQLVFYFITLYDDEILFLHTVGFELTYDILFLINRILYLIAAIYFRVINFLNIALSYVICLSADAKI